MGEFQFQDGGSRAHADSQSEIGRDGLLQSVVGYYRSGHGRDPQPDPTGYEADTELPRGDKVRIAALLIVGFVFFFIQFRGQI